MNDRHEWWGPIAPNDVAKLGDLWFDTVNFAKYILTPCGWRYVDHPVWR